MAFDFTGKKILITGVGRGIGRALAVAIDKAGGQVYGLSRQQENLDSLVAECPRIVPIKVDLSDWETTLEAVEKLPVMNCLVNNAGISCPWKPSVEVTKDEVERTFSVNLMGALNVTQVVAKKMIAEGNGGSIVNVSSINGCNPMRESMPYNMSKAALDMMSKQFALKLGPHNIRVNSIQPTAVKTDLTKNFWEIHRDKFNKMIDHTPLGRFAGINEVVGPIMYLLSDVSSVVTGTMNPVEGGLLSNISV